MEILFSLFVHLCFGGTTFAAFYLGLMAWEGQRFTPFRKEPGVWVVVMLLILVLWPVMALVGVALVVGFGLVFLAIEIWPKAWTARLRGHIKEVLED